MQANQLIVQMNVKPEVGSTVIYNGQAYRVEGAAPLNTPFNSPMPMQMMQMAQSQLPELDISEDATTDEPKDVCEMNECLNVIEQALDEELMCQMHAQEARDAVEEFDEIMRGIEQTRETYEYKMRKAMYKTELCQNVDTPEGCVYGDMCTFAHSSAELRKKVFSDELTVEYLTRRFCEQYMKGRRYKEKACKNGDNCPYGFMCDFYHENDPVQRCTFGCAAECDSECDMLHLQDELFKRRYMTSEKYTCTCNSAKPCPEGASYA